ncbi:MAG: hypothetical protein OEY94_06440 [Alphaproteobacteria bacterium]|nr:hypothetical protein [Alphaproteobacteria bacterium]
MIKRMGDALGSAWEKLHDKCLSIGERAVEGTNNTWVVAKMVGLGAFFLAPVLYLADLNGREAKENSLTDDCVETEHVPAGCESENPTNNDDIIDEKKPRPSDKSNMLAWNAADKPDSSRLTNEENAAVQASGLELEPQ